MATSSSSQSELRARVAQLSMGAPEARIEASRTIARAANSSQPGVIQNLIAVGAVDGLSRQLKLRAGATAREERRAAALALSSIIVAADGSSVGSAIPDSTISSVLATLVEMLVGASAEALEAEGEVLAVLQAMTGLCEGRRALVAVANLSSSLLDTALEGLALHIGSQTDGEVANAAGWLLCLLATDEDTGATVTAHPRALPALMRYGSRADPTAQEECAWALATLSAEHEAATLLANREEFFGLLLRLLGRPCETVRLQAAWALANLSLHPVGKGRIASMPCVGPLVSVSCVVPPPPAHTLCGARRLDTALTSRWDLILTPGLPPTLVQALSDTESDEVLHQVARCMRALLSLEQGRQQLLELREADVAGGTSAALDVLVRLTSHATPTVGDAAARALMGACMTPKSAAAAFLQLPGGVARLKELLSGPEGERQKFATATIGRLAAACSSGPALALGPIAPGTLALNRREREKAAPSPAPLLNCIDPLVKLLALCEDKPTRIQAATALGELARCPLEGEGAHAIAARIVHAGALSLLQHLSVSAEDDALQAACRGALEPLMTCLTPNSVRAYGNAEPSGGELTASGERRQPRLRRHSPLNPACQGSCAAPRVELSCTGGIAMAWRNEMRIDATVSTRQAMTP